MSSKRIGFLGYDGLQALDLVGPLEAFMTAVDEKSDGDGTPQACYEVLIIGLTEEPFTAETGIVFHPHKAIDNVPALDTLIIPGGKTLRSGETSGRISEWLIKRAGKIRRIVSVCTGIYALAPTGLLDGRQVTTHWRFSRDLAQRFPKLKVNANALFIKDDKFYTSAGITSGIDLSMALIEEDYGSAVALAVARELVVYLKRPGGQEQYSEPLQFQILTTDHFADLVTWVGTHLRHDLSIETLAAKAHLCPRHFSRRFKEDFGVTPGVFVERLRLDEARRRLAEHNSTIEAVGHSVGFKSAKAFRRTFEKKFGISPSSYRSRFPSPARAASHQKDI